MEIVYRPSAIVTHDWGSITRLILQITVGFTVLAVSQTAADRSANLSLGIDQKWQVKYGRGMRKPQEVNDILAGPAESVPICSRDKPLGNQPSLALRPVPLTGESEAITEFSLQGLKLDTRHPIAWRRILTK
jgi:hypothetical protein